MNKKKVLIITYYWPPAGGPGVQRWLKFVKYLPEFDIEPIVYCPYNPIYPQKDESLLAEVSKKLKVLKQPINEPYKIANFFSKDSKTISKGIIPDEKKQSLAQKALLFIRGNFFIPDARKHWIKPSVRYLMTYINDFNIDTIITSGPPHSLHLIGLQLKEKTGVEWLTDFRDPWTTIGYHKQLKLTHASKKRHKALEREVLNTADSIIVTSDNTKSEFSKITNKPITVITNGYDIEKTENIILDSQFTVSHIGSLLSKRNPQILWKVLSELIIENDDFAKSFKLNLVGSVGASVLKSIKDYNLMSHLTVVGYVSHKEALKFQKQSQVLLLIEIDSIDTKAIIPGKLFEYMVSERPILAIGPTNTDVEKIIKETNTGHYFNYDSTTELKHHILVHFKSFQKNTLKTNPIGLQKYSRKNLTQTLAQLILK
ncbi:glycosyltransferase family 4 protein [Lacinutrix neustonica]|uniref:Glycosyltransferase family 4 protein n=1 Tax=Lacinutrix neustonica TaxID=2980107 RepID=A0A9E8MWD4_9FLAO|nr:glycosyltransferase family 4 protein [Lacinutrix neustonica]WAC02576.1 glycosyltransferase family 4 protein [Lacinutrix neustonica]